MKILLIAGTFPKISETFILDQAIGLLNEGADLECLSLHRSLEPIVHRAFLDHHLSSNTVTSNIPLSKLAMIYKLPKTIIAAIQNHGLARTLRAASFRSYYKLYRSIQTVYLLASLPSLEYDVILCHFGNNGVLGAKLKDVGFRGQVVTVFHGSDVSSNDVFVNHHYDELFATGDLFLPISHYWNHRLVAFGCPKEKTHTLHLGVDVDHLEFRPRALPSGRPMKFLTVGRLVPNKGHEIAIRALAQLYLAHPDFTYTVIGDGPLNGQLRELAKQLGVSNNVQFVGLQDHDSVIDHMNRSDVFLLASHSIPSGQSEGLPVVLMEAMALGLPVVSVDLTGIPELISDRRSGVLVQEDSVSAFRDGIHWLIDNPHRWRLMEQQARNTVELHFNAKTQVHTLYRTLLDAIATPL